MHGIDPNKSLNPFNPFLAMYLAVTVTCSHPNNDPIARLAAELDVHHARQLLPRA